MIRKFFCILLVVVMTGLAFTGCNSEQEKKEEAIQGDWYSTFIFGFDAKYTYEDGKFENYLIKDGDEQKMAWGTYEIKGNKIYEYVEDVADVEGIKPSKDSKPKKIIFEGDEAVKIDAGEMEFTREKP